MSRASNDAELVARVLDSAGHTVGYLVTVVAVAIVLPILDWRLALVVLIPLPLLSVGFWRYSARYAERTRVLQEELAVSTALAEETITGIRVVKGLGAGPELERRFRAASDRIVDARAGGRRRRRALPACARGAAADRHPGRPLVRGHG